MPENTIEIPTEDGEHVIWLAYNGEPCFELRIENLPGEVKPGDDLKKLIAARMTVNPMPINGGLVPETVIDLPMQGD